MNRSYSTIPAFAEKHAAAFTVPGLRWLRFNQKTNGFAEAFVAVGRRVLIDEERFFECIEKLNRQEGG